MQVKPGSLQRAVANNRKSADVLMGKEMSSRETVNWLKRYKSKGAINIATGQKVFVMDPDQHGRHSFIVEYNDVMQGEYGSEGFIEKYKKSRFIEMSPTDYAYKTPAFNKNAQQPKSIDS